MQDHVDNDNLPNDRVKQKANEMILNNGQYNTLI